MFQRFVWVECKARCELLSSGIFAVSSSAEGFSAAGSAGPETVARLLDRAAARVLSGVWILAFEFVLVEGVCGSDLLLWKPSSHTSRAEADKAASPVEPRDDVSPAAFGL